MVRGGKGVMGGFKFESHPGQEGNKKGFTPTARALQDFVFFFSFSFSEDKHCFSM